MYSVPAAYIQYSFECRWSNEASYHPEIGVSAPAAGNAVVVMTAAPGDGARDLTGVPGGLLTGEMGGLAAGEPPVKPGGYRATATSSPAYAGGAASGPPAAAAQHKRGERL